MTDTVLIGTTTTNRGSRVYHTDPDCHRLPTKSREWDRDEAEAWGYSEFDYCIGTLERRPDGGDHSLYQRLVEIGENGGDEIDV